MKRTEDKISDSVSSDLDILESLKHAIAHDSRDEFDDTIASLKFWITRRPDKISKAALVSLHELTSVASAAEYPKSEGAFHGDFPFDKTSDRMTLFWFLVLAQQHCPWLVEDDWFKNLASLKGWQGKPNLAPEDHEKFRFNLKVLSLYALLFPRGVNLQNPGGRDRFIFKKLAALPASKYFKARATDEDKIALYETLTVFAEKLPWIDCLTEHQAITLLKEVNASPPAVRKAGDLFLCYVRNYRMADFHQLFRPNPKNTGSTGPQHSSKQVL